MQLLKLQQFQVGVFLQWCILFPGKRSNFPPTQLDGTEDSGNVSGYEVTEVGPSTAVERTK